MFAGKFEFAESSRWDGGLDRVYRGLGSVGGIARGVGLTGEYVAVAFGV
jgi:hypothetical protein